ncbi:unnamed protein product, partial [Didymodactylos carnosus]
ITFYDLCKDLKNSMSVSNVIQSLYLLLKYGLVIVAGNVTRLFINRKFARSWLICSIRFQDNIFDKMDLDKTSLETYLTTTVAETSVDVCDINEIKNLHTTTTSNKLATDQFQHIYYTPRPWKFVDGHINFIVLQRMMESVLLFVIDHPGISIDSLYDHYQSVLLPIAIQDLVELFEQIQCLTTIRVRKTRQEKINLYSNEDEDDAEIEDDFSQDDEPLGNDDDDDDSDDDLLHLKQILLKTHYDHKTTTIYCFPTYDCMIKFGLTFPTNSSTSSESEHQQQFFGKMSFSGAFATK